jgi:hypothetical protein
VLPALLEATNDELVAQLAARVRAERLALAGEGGLQLAIAERSRRLEHARFRGWPVGCLTQTPEVRARG